MTRYKKYRIALCVYLFISIIFLVSAYISDIKKSLPDSIKIIVNKDNSFSFNLPIEADIISVDENEAMETLTISNAKIDNSGDIHFSMADSFTVKAEQTGSCKLDLKLFGVFELSKISLDVVERQELMPCGNVIGIHVDTDGLLVLGTGTVKCTDGLSYEPAAQIVHTGDYIKSVNGRVIGNIEELQNELQRCEDDNVVLTIERNDIISDVSVPVVDSEDGINRIGVWVRQDTQGIGTLTYISTDNTFGALGHAITDTDTGLIMKQKSGEIYDAEIIQVIKGDKGCPGELMGMILESGPHEIGKIKRNTPFGIEGKVSNNYIKNNINSESEFLPIALRQEIKKGPAYILCQLDDTVQRYDVEIIEINRGSDDNKGMMIKITDDKLIERTGGIVQGMSGSPIIQEGKIVGAVTHVLVNDPTRGYGIFIENMLEHN